MNVLKNIDFKLFGESHGDYIGMVLTGFPSGIKIPHELIENELSKRRPQGQISTSRVEKDDYKFISGVFNDYTTGEAITVIIPNKNKNSNDYEPMFPRPSHSDLNANLKTNGFNDYRGGGAFSGRLTTPIVIMGTITKALLKTKNILIFSQIKQIGTIIDDEITINENTINFLQNQKFPCFNQTKTKQMYEEINAIVNSDSIGGLIKTYAVNVPKNLGGSYFSGVESMISYLIYGIPAVKSISFGDGYQFLQKKGSQSLDEPFYQNRKINYLNNHNGGIIGGITNGQPIIVNTIIKPTPTINQEVKTINLETKENVTHHFKGRHDPCIVPRAYVPIESLLAVAILDLLISNFGYQYFEEK